MKLEFFDIHAHVNFSAFDADRDEVIKRALEAGVWMANVGTQADTSRKAIELAEKYKEGVYAIVGLHPIHTAKSFHDEKELGEGGKEFSSRGEVFDSKTYLEMVKHPKVVAVGECGLDYYRHDTNTRMDANDTNKKKQEEVFRKQIELAIEVKKPLMLHIRNAYDDAFEILNSYFLIHNSKLRANLHFYAGDVATAKKFLDLGFSFSFTGVVSFARDYDEVIRYLPLDRIMSETDCPYVSPTPYRGKRNEPLYVKETVLKIAQIKDLDFEEVKKTLVANTRGFFGIQF